MKFRLIIDPQKEEETVVIAKEKSAFTEALEALVMNYNGNDRITVQNESTIKELVYSDIECVTVLCGKTLIISRDGERYYTNKRLYELEEKLPESFIRINKSALANKNHIEKFTVSYSGGVDAVFKSGYSDYVSRRCFAKIKNILR